MADKPNVTYFERSNFTREERLRHTKSIICPYCTKENVKDQHRFRTVPTELGVDVHQLHYCVDCRRQFIVVERKRYVPIHVYEAPEDVDIIFTE